jgi:hypothetical protein
MTEAEWLSWSDPIRMLLFLQQRGKGGARQLRKRTPPALAAEQAA